MAWIVVCSPYGVMFCFVEILLNLGLGNYANVIALPTSHFTLYYKKAKLVQCVSSVVLHNELE